MAVFLPSSLPLQLSPSPFFLLTVTTTFQLVATAREVHHSLILKHHCSWPPWLLTLLEGHICMSALALGAFDSGSPFFRDSHMFHGAWVHPIFHPRRTSWGYKQVHLILQHQSSITVAIFLPLYQFPNHISFVLLCSIFMGISSHIKRQHLLCVFWLLK